MASPTTFNVAVNNASSTLAGNVDNSSNPVTVNVQSGDGAKFGSSFPYPITIDNEILLCTARSTDALTCSRAQEGTTIASHTTNTAVQARSTAKFINDLNTAVNNIETGTKTLDHVTVDGSSGVNINRVGGSGNTAIYYGTSWDAIAGVQLYRKSSTDTRIKWLWGTENVSGQDPDLVTYAYTGASGSEVATERFRVLNASAGVRVPNASYYKGRNAAGSGDISMWKVDSNALGSDQIMAGANVDLGANRLQNPSAIYGQASASSLILAGFPTGAAPAQRDVVIQTPNAANPQTLSTRMSFNSNAAQGAANILVYEGLVFNSGAALAVSNLNTLLGDSQTNSLVIGAKAETTNQTRQIIIQTPDNAAPQNQVTRMVIPSQATQGNAGILFYEPLSFNGGAGNYITNARQLFGDTNTGTSLNIAGNPSGNNLQRDITIQTPNAASPMVNQTRMYFSSQAAQGAAYIQIYEQLRLNDLGGDAGTNGTIWNNGGYFKYQSNAVGMFAPIIKYKTTDKSITSQATPQTDTDFDFTVTSGSVWALQFYFPTNVASSSPGFNMRFAAPTSTSGIFSMSLNVAGSNYIDTETTTTPGSTPLGLITGTNSGLCYVYANATITMGGAGTFHTQWCQNASSTDATTLKAGSYMIATRLS